MCEVNCESDDFNLEHHCLAVFQSTHHCGIQAIHHNLFGCSGPE